MNRYLLCAAMLLPGQDCIAADSQPPVLDAATTDEQQYLSLIEREQDTNGLTSPALIESLTMLGQYYFAAEDYDSAFDAFARARQIMRVNDGFDTLGELSLLAHLARTEEARGHFEEAWVLEESLLALAGQNVGKIETLPVFRKLAEKRLEILERYRAGDYPPQIVLGCYYDRRDYNATMGMRTVRSGDGAERRGNCTAGDRRVVSLALLLEARAYQILALEALLQNDGYAGEDLWDLFSDILINSYAIMQRARSYADAPLANTLARLLSYEPAAAAERIRRAQILVQLADLNVARSREFDRYNGFDNVYEQYRQAYTTLRDEGLSQVELEAIFAPTLPVVLPSVAPNPLETGASMDAAAWIDVSFELTRRGIARRIDARASSAAIDRAEVRALERLIDQATFRPRVVEGEVVDAAQVSLRYYPGATPAENDAACGDADTEVCVTAE